MRASGHRPLSRRRRHGRTRGRRSRVAHRRAGHRSVHQRHARRRHQHDLAVSHNTSLSLDGNRLTAAFRLANRKLSLAMQEDESLRTMATTAAALLINKGTPVVAHAGDSRLYRWRNGTLIQIT